MWDFLSNIVGNAVGVGLIALIVFFLGLIVKNVVEIDQQTKEMERRFRDR